MSASRPLETCVGFPCVRIRVREQSAPSRDSMIDLFSSCLPRPPEGSTSLTLTSALASSLACLPDLAQFLTCMPWLHPSTPANMVATGPAPEPQPSIQHEPSLAAASNSLPTTRETSTAHPNQHATSQQIMCAEKTMPGGPPSAPAHEPARAFPSQPSDPSLASLSDRRRR